MRTSIALRRQRQVLSLKHGFHATAWESSMGERSQRESVGCYCRDVPRILVPGFVSYPSTSSLGGFHATTTCSGSSGGSSGNVRRVLRPAGRQRRVVGM